MTNITDRTRSAALAAWCVSAPSCRGFPEISGRGASRTGRRPRAWRCPHTQIDHGDDECDDDLWNRNEVHPCAPCSSNAPVSQLGFPSLDEAHRRASTKASCRLPAFASAVAVAGVAFAHTGRRHVSGRRSLPVAFGCSASARTPRLAARSPVATSGGATTRAQGGTAQRGALGLVHLDGASGTDRVPRTFRRHAAMAVERYWLIRRRWAAVGWLLPHQLETPSARFTATAGVSLIEPIRDVAGDVLVARVAGSTKRMRRNSLIDQTLRRLGTHALESLRRQGCAPEERQVVGRLADKQNRRDEDVRHAAR